MVYSALKGRIGNNLFQIAAGYSLAKKNNSDFLAYVQDIMLPEPDNCLLSEYLNQFKDNIFRDIKFTNCLPDNYELYNEPSDLSFREIVYKDNICIDGYFTSEKYFDKSLIRDLFSIDDITNTYIERKYGNNFENKITSINIRRGDFVKQPHLHPVCSLSYYKDSIRYIGERNHFMITSDDIDWCKKHFKGTNYCFIEDEPPIIDLYLQTLCNNNIISNSSFSWWGAWLNPNPDKIVIAPSENWVGRHLNISIKDYLLQEWIKIPNPMAIHLSVIVFYYDIVRYLVSVKKSIETFAWKK